MFSPKLGRFINRDPIGYAGGINQYEYVGGRPAQFTDALGLQGAAVAPGGLVVSTLNPGVASTTVQGMPIYPVLAAGVPQRPGHLPLAVGAIQGICMRLPDCQNQGGTWGFGNGGNVRLDIWLYIALNVQRLGNNWPQQYGHEQQHIQAMLGYLNQQTTQTAINAFLGSTPTGGYQTERECQLAKQAALKSLWTMLAWGFTHGGGNSAAPGIATGPAQGALMQPQGGVPPGAKPTRPCPKSRRFPNGVRPFNPYADLDYTEWYCPMQQAAIGNLSYPDAMLGLADILSSHVSAAKVEAV